MEPFTQLAMAESKPITVSSSSRGNNESGARLGRSRNQLSPVLSVPIVDRSLIANLGAPVVLIESPRPKARCFQSQICMRAPLPLPKYSRFPSDLDP